MYSTIKKSLLLSFFLLLIYLASCNTNSNTNNKNNKVVKQNKEKSTETIPFANNQKIIDTSLSSEIYKSDNYFFIGSELLTIESLGEIKIDLKTKELIELLGEPEKKSKLITWGADGRNHQTWYYNNKGIEFDIIGENDTNQIVSWITINAPCTLKTKRHIGIGSDINDVKRAYKKAIDPTFSDSKSIVAGSIYGGIIFSIEKKKVKQIFFGEAAF